MAQGTDTTNFKGKAIDSKEGYKVNGTTIITAAGAVTADIQAAAGSIGTAELANAGVTNAKLGAPKIGIIQETVSYDDFTDNEDATGTYELGTDIPAGALFLQATITAVTKFAGDTSATLTIGDGTDVDRYNTGTPSVFANAVIVAAGAASGTAIHATAATPTLTLTSATDFTSVSAGQVTVTLYYYQAA